MQKMLAQPDIVNGLKLLGVQRGAAVEVHGSLSSLGLVEGGTPAVIQALMEVVGEEFLRTDPFKLFGVENGM